MRNIEYLIIGQGLAGTFLAHELDKAGTEFLIIDKPGGASRVASGIINPVTGRRIVETWMIDELLPFAEKAYRHLEKELKVDFCRTTEVLDFFPTPQMRLAFTDRLQAGSDYLALPNDENEWQKFLNYDFGYGIIKPALVIDPAVLVDAFRVQMLKRNLIIEDHFQEDELIVHDDEINYMDISAEKIIFCDGSAGSNSLYFNKLPFALNKGEALILEIPGMPAGPVLKKGISLVPWKDGLFWAGSSHEWSFETDGPTDLFRERTLAALKAFCKLPFTLVDHLSGVRPATLERRPFLGFHPTYPAVGIFNGMGTKGCSLAPYFAKQLVASIVDDQPLDPLVSIARFKGVLSRGA